jgi:o-succinylbenzoate synthase
MKANYKRHLLQFIRPGGTSRGVLTQKETWFLTIREENRTGIGECALFRGLSTDDLPNYEEKLQWVCRNIESGLDFLLGELTAFPSIRFGLEQAFLSLESGDPYLLYPSAFTRSEAPIPINGLIWMGDRKYMESQLDQKIAMGFRCLKLKIGAIDFETEMDILQGIRARYSSDVVELRVDANGAFGKEDAFQKLDQLSTLGIHSIEQPVKPGQHELMKELCKSGLVDIALDEELIGVFSETKKRELLQIIQPRYIILKPSLLGGYRSSEEWITLAGEMGIDWWVTSALESNVGLNAIAQWAFTLGNNMPQGLGTGQLFANNVDSPLEVEGGKLWYRKDRKWETNLN